MPLLRLLSATLLASAFVLQASAQSPTISSAQTPLPSSNPLTPKVIGIIPTIAPQIIGKITKPDSFLAATNNLVSVPLQLNLSKGDLDVLNRTLQAQLNAACYTMRSYGFTYKDLQSTAPRPSTSTSCSPASNLALKDVRGVAAK